MFLHIFYDGNEFCYGISKKFGREGKDEMCEIVDRDERIIVINGYYHNSNKSEEIIC